MRVFLGTYIKNVARVAWHEGKHPRATLVFELEWNEGIGVVDCPDWATLQRLTEGTIIRHDGRYSCVLEYAFDDANYPLKREPEGENKVFLLSDEEVSTLRSIGRLSFRFNASHVAEDARALHERLAGISRCATGVA